MATCFVAVLGLRLASLPPKTILPPSIGFGTDKRRTPRKSGAFFFYYGFMLSLPEKVVLLPAAQNGIDKCRDWAAGKPI